VLILLMVQFASDDWLYVVKLGALMHKKLDLEQAKAELGVETAQRELKKVQSETEIERMGGRSLNLPENTIEILSKLPPKVADSACHYLAFVEWYGSLSGNDILQAAIGFDSSLPRLARYTESEGADLLLKGFNKGLDVMEKLLPQKLSSP
jgi:hypothetical protein